LERCADLVSKDSMDSRILRIGAREEIHSRVIENLNARVSLRVFKMNDADALKALRDDRIDVAVVPNILAAFGEKTELFNEHMMLAAPREWMKAATWNDLRDDHLWKRAAASV